MRVACSITLTEEERQALEGLLNDASTPKRLLLRTKIVLLAFQGESNQQIAARLNTDPHTVGRWRNRFRIDRFEGLKRKPATLNGSHISRHAEIARRILEKRQWAIQPKVPVGRSVLWLQNWASAVQRFIASGRMPA